MKQGKMHYLNFRTLCAWSFMVLFLAALLGYLIYEKIRGNGAGWFPVIFGGCLLVLGICYAVVEIWLPYRRIEKRIELFLDGYTTSNLVGEDGIHISPELESLVSKMQYLMQSQEMLNLNKRQAQYLALQNQINPHFLYNTLESIRSEALIAGLVSVADMTEALATFFRYTISKVENLVSVEEELQNCMTYFKIQQYRFGDRLQLSVECDPEEKAAIYSCRIPKLTLQPILENSIIHGTECKLGTGHIRILLEMTESCLLLCISDDGNGMEERKVADINERLQKSGGILATGESEAKGGIALVNVNNRIHLLFGEEYGIHVYSMPEIGTDVKIRIPVIYSDRNLIHMEERQENYC